MTNSLRLVLGFAVWMAALPLAAQTSGTFTCAVTKDPAKALTAESRYTATSPGWDLAAGPESVQAGSCSSAKPFFFSIAEPDGNYEVTLVLGGAEASTMTVKAESRRLMLYAEKILAKGSHTFVFNVNVRTDKISTGGAVRLKPREIGALDWDDKLTLEFNGDHPSVRSISIRPVNVPTVYLAGDSTVVDQDKEPWAAWGQMLPVFFGTGVAISNQAESGETIKSFVGEKRLEKVMSTITAGDSLLIQFGHNDQKSGAGYVPAETMFKDYLHSYIQQAQAKGATVILVTPMNRRNFNADGKIEQTLGDYPQAFREVAAEQKLGLLDLNAMSKTLFETMGPDGTLHAFVHYPANTFPEQAEELKDDTHFNAYGAYELARCIVEAMRTQRLPLAKQLRSGIPDFNPAKPDALANFAVPASPFVSTATPYGR